MKKPTPILFIDLAAAFNHVNRSLLFRTIRHRLPSTSNAKLFDLLQSLYSYTTSALVQTPDDYFEITNGVRQGGPESPILFNLYIDFVILVFLQKCKENNVSFLKLKYRIPSSVTHSKKVSIGTQSIDWIGYADDVALAFEDIKNLKIAINILNEVLETYHLEINAKKTKTMILNHQYMDDEYPAVVVRLGNNKPIENVKSFIYLGCTIKYNEPSTGDNELEVRIDTAECKFYEIAKNLLNHKISLITRVKILNSLVRSRLTYSCQTWTLTKKHNLDLRACYLLIFKI